MSPKRPQQPVVESNKFLNADEDQIPEFDDDGDDLLCVDGSLHNASDDGYSRTSDLNREWERQHNQFHTICYRDGLTAGKEASAQDGFVAGFKQSVLIGYKWGHVRGICRWMGELKKILSLFKCSATTSMQFTLIKVNIN